MVIEVWEKDLNKILSEFKEQTSLTEKNLFVVGCSTSEVAGRRIGTAGTEETAAMIFRQIKLFQEQTGVQLAFQCCEHLNRALVVERSTAEEKGLEEVAVIPVRSAGGAMATYAFDQFADPVIVEYIKADAGIDIGDTFIGMHLKPVAVPVRVSLKQVGGAHVTLAKTRPKLIGGSRAVYEKNRDEQSCH
ncbi:TIGR01440 family protein [Bacillus sp. V3-13]|uniref:TIGR01440 family protein n=1 Tax=Bacillus sp. V3-13 TaxID=2053728 RepID=UPI000C773E58|nr:TIGR01440 family protein [Bacillus sp. V3-13]PLR76805.1 TIGR01440 family protein [Bacillus sp. V3-13]